MKQRTVRVVSRGVSHFNRTKPLYPSRVKTKSFKISSPEDIEKAESLCRETLNKIDRKAINELILYNDKLNSPVRYNSLEIKEIMRAREGFSDKWAKQSPNFSEILKRSQQLESVMIIPIPQLRSNLKGSWQRLMMETLNLIGIKDGMVIRFFIPGNNDQSNPIWVANQIDFAIHYLKALGIRSLSFQVLILGKGGHASTAIFPQTCLLNRKKIKNGKYVEEFQGIPEARSLAYTLDIALRRKGFKPKVVDFIKRDKDNRIKKGGFSSSKPKGIRIEIMQECNSTNTEQNVLAAKACDLEKNLRPRNFFVTCAITASTRQALTFAKCYKDKDDYYYETISAIPLVRLPDFIKSFTNMEACTELFAGLAERSKFYFYSYQLDYIPPSLVDKKELKNLFSIYASLSGKSLKEAMQEGIESLYKFFVCKFRILEKVILCNIPHKGVLSKEGHIRANQQVVGSMFARSKWV